MEDVRINSGRLWGSLMEMARIGGTPAGGVCRLALTDLARESRDLFIAWCEEAGCVTHFDAAGNVFARRAGADDALAPVMTGSHLDTQPTGGKFDGAYGVLAGLEVVRTLNDHGIETAAPVEVAAWTNEEGCRFTPSMAGSGAFACVYDFDYVLARTDESGVSIGAELTRIGYAGEPPPGGRPVAAYFEAHIEQGPVLEAENITIGVVTGGQGKRSYEVTLSGQEAHAGTTPMAVRRDALQGAAQMIAEADRIALDNAPHAVATVGMVSVIPNSRNTIPGTAFFSADMRHPDRGGFSTPWTRNSAAPAKTSPKPRASAPILSRFPDISRWPSMKPASPPCAPPPEDSATATAISSRAPGMTPVIWPGSPPPA